MHSILSLNLPADALPARPWVDHLAPPLTIPLGGRPAGRDDAAVLLVCDEPERRSRLADWLEVSGYTVDAVSAPEAALAQAAQAAPAVVVCSLPGSGPGGFELVAGLRSACADAALIVVSERDDTRSLEAAWRHGVQDFVSGPPDRERFLQAVLDGFHRYCQLIDLRSWQQTLRDETQHRRTQLLEALSARPIQSTEDLDGLLVRLTGSSRSLCWHAFRVADLTGRLAATLGVSAEETSTIARAALVHDIGLLTLPRAITRKPAPLSRGEQAIVRQHPGAAYELLRGVPLLSAAAPIVRSIREWFDGSGYPGGIGGEEIPWGSRIVAVVEVYDTAMTARPYRDARGRQAAIEEVARVCETQLDPRVVEAFRGLVGVPTS